MSSKLSFIAEEKKKIQLYIMVVKVFLSIPSFIPDQVSRQRI